MAADDLYKCLQVDPQSEPEVLRAAYHALARKYHPDMGGNLWRMVQVNAAWAILGNPVTRAAYDEERQRPAIAVANPVPAPPPASQNTAPAAPLRAHHDASTILDFGRYAGWSLRQVADKDSDYLEWMIRTPIGRRVSAEARMLLDNRAACKGAARVGARDRAPAGRHWFGRASQAR